METDGTRICFYYRDKNIISSVPVGVDRECLNGFHRVLSIRDEIVAS